jgi:hypothetical protein
MIRISTLSRSIAADSLQVQRRANAGSICDCGMQEAIFPIVGAKVSVCRGVNGMFAASGTIHDVERDGQLETIDTTNWSPRVMRKDYIVALAGSGRQAPTRQRSKDIRRHAPQSCWRRLHDPTDVALSFGQDVDERLAVQAQRHCMPQIGVVEGHPWR